MHVTRSTPIALVFTVLAASVGGAQASGSTKPAAAPAPSAAQMDAAAAQFKSLGLLAYPAKGQSADKQKKDQAECYAWSKEQTGFDPATAAAVNSDSVAKAAQGQASQATQLVASHGGRAATVSGAEEATLWASHTARPWGGAGTVVKMAMMPTEVRPTLAWIDQELCGVEWEAVGRAGVGVLLLRINGDAPQQQHAIEALRSRVPPGRGSVVVVRASDEVKRVVDVWGPAGDALPVMRAIKHAFDPAGLLNPGRGPFGL